MADPTNKFDLSGMYFRFGGDGISAEQFWRAMSIAGLYFAQMGVDILTMIATYPEPLAGPLMGAANAGNAAIKSSMANFSIQSSR